ncbi:hypothetical protein [Thalassospira tepidiphila]|uniref:hypothetical protein n=1 Tax=Thalassospira tepidiphila TaxID=393657 RepID=UPI0030C70296
MTISDCLSYSGLTNIYTNSFSGDHLLSVLADLLVLIALLSVPWLMIAKENSGKVTKRLPFSVWTLVVIVIVPLVIDYAIQLVEESLSKGLIAVLGFVVPATFYAREVVRRARDAGHGKKLPYGVFMLPGINFLIMIYLIFASSRNDGAPELKQDVSAGSVE